MSHKLIITLPDKTQYEVDARRIADSRAIYYADADHGVEKRDTDEWRDTYAAEYKYTMENTSELFDWAFNNMDWSDVAHEAKRVKQAEEADPAEFWGDTENAKFEFVTEQNGEAQVVDSAYDGDLL